jgi:hypothetical protein
MELTNENYTITAEPGSIVVRRNRPRAVTSTVIDHDGQIASTMPLNELMPGYDPTVFDATPSGSEWWVDYDCGFQRWYGRMSCRELSGGIRRMGFDPRRVIRLARSAGA